MKKFDLNIFFKLFIPLYLLLATIVFILMPSYIGNFASFLAGISTVGIFILTSFYVFFTNRQISELQKQRELQIQPLPNLEILNGSVYSPRLCIDRSKKGKLCFRIDFNISGKLKNIGNGTAVFVDVFCEFIGKEIKFKPDSIFAFRFFVFRTKSRVRF